jgi:hypothetical protein
MERKLNEFLALTQGTRTVLQYAQAFNHLCQYAGYHADNDTKKQDHFRRGLNTKLKECLNLVKPYQLIQPKFRKLWIGSLQLQSIKSIVSLDWQDIIANSFQTSPK